MAMPSTPPRAYRSTSDRYVAGVCGGLAVHLGVPALWLRIGFVTTTLLGGFGIGVYGGLWLLLPLDRGELRAAPGLEAATRLGKRPGPKVEVHDAGVLVAVAAVLLGLLALFSRIGGGWVFFWPIVAGVMGLAVLWFQADEAQRERWASPDGPVGPLRVIFGKGGPVAAARIGAGLTLVFLSLFLVALQTGRLSLAVDVTVAAAVGLVGVALVLGPWLVRMASDLSVERAERIRSQERADVAAHLHDSVLQTLALIQNQAEDGKAVARLARAQERDLRRWLYDEATPGAATLSAALKEAAAEVEDLHDVRIGVVTVGEAMSSERTTPLVLAAREAMTNAARHSGVADVAVFVEVVDGTASVFVRDRGKGFDLDGIADGRLGVRKSIEERMARHGGSAQIRTSPGDGTEVRLTMKVDE